MDKDLVLRPGQKSILEYRSGKMGISAVPGSGKTWTLSLLAAQIIESGELTDDQEILIVTLVNSAVDNFSHRISQFLHARRLFSNIGYRVRTLHGLAHDIVYERPGLVHLSDSFQIIDEREADSIRSEVAQAWYKAHQYDLDEYLKLDMEEGKKDWLRRDVLPKYIAEIAMEFIRYAKDLRLTPEQLLGHLESTPVPLPLAEMGCEMYNDYQRALAYRGAVDFDDLIRLAIQALESDLGYLERLRYRWPYLLEDEAQDSSRLQEEILKLLAGDHGNWVRVGDPNQAIYESFTTASPEFLRRFLTRDDVRERDLPESGRSTQTIINLANYLVRWTQSEHPVDAVQDALSGPPYIEPTPPGDPQPNPPDRPDHVYVSIQKYSPREEIHAVATSIERWLPENQDSTVAVLAPRNKRAFDLADELRLRGIPCNDSLLRSSSSTRETANLLELVLEYLSKPGDSKKLAELFKVWQRKFQEIHQVALSEEKVANHIKRIGNVEDYIWPGPAGDWLENIAIQGLEEDDLASLYEFRNLIRRWQSAISLPIDQLILTLAQDLFVDTTELAIAHKLAILLRSAKELHPIWQLPELIKELKVIAENERRFLGFSAEDVGFDPEMHKGEVVVTTVHKAKGLEWDKVYLMSVSNYDFPGAQEFDRYISDKWYFRPGLNLGAESLSQLQTALVVDEYNWYQEGAASQQARLEFVRERLRLLYVGITRARKELVLIWNTGRGKEPSRPALALVALHSFWEDSLGGGQE